MTHLLPLAAALARVDGRHEGARALARAMGGSDMLVFVRDAAVNALVPAAGFPGALPGGADWDRFLDACRAPGIHEVMVAYPMRHDRQRGLAHVDAEGTVLLLLGDRGSFSRVEEIGVPLLSALFRTEQVAQAAIGEAEAARESVRLAEATLRAR